MANFFSWLVYCTLQNILSKIIGYYSCITPSYSKSSGCNRVIISVGKVVTQLYIIIRESVDSLCRDGADAQYMQYLSKSRITSPQTRKKFI